MKKFTLHLKMLILSLLFLGIGTVLYQVFVLKIPVTKSQIENSWIIDTRIDLGNNNKSIKAKMFLPPENGHYKRIFEAFIPEVVGKKIETVENNRIVTLSARKKVNSVVYYRLLVAASENENTIANSVGKDYREPIELVDGPEKTAIYSLLDVARAKSSDVETLVSQTIKLVNDENASSDVQVLVDKKQSLNKKIKIIELILSYAHIPIELVHTIDLMEANKQQATTWIRTYVNQTWLYFNPVSGEVGLPSNHLIWWYGNGDLLDISNKEVSATVNFTVKHTPTHALELLRKRDIADKTPDVLNFSLYELPLSTQQHFLIMFMLPLGVLVVLILRNLVGLSTLGTFTPVLIALAFRETSLLFGLILFSIVISMGLLLRAYLESLKLQMLPRLSVVLTFVLLMIALISLIGYKLDIQQALSVTLFPMVILTMTIERISITWEERGYAETLKIILGTLVAATLAYLLMNLSSLAYFVFTFPAILLVMIAFMLLMGRYRGYRLTELMRFKAMQKD